MQWKCLPVPRTSDGKPGIHYTTIYKAFAKWPDDGSLERAFVASVRHLAAHNHFDLSILHGEGTDTVAKKGGDGIGYSGHKQQKGEKILAIIGNNGFVLAPVPAAPVKEADTVLLPEGLNALKRMARLTDLSLEGSHLNLDGGFDSRRNRKAIFDAGLIPNIRENLRNRKAPNRGRKRLFNLFRDIFPAARCVLLICFLSTTNTPQLAAGIFYYRRSFITATSGADLRVGG